MAAIISVVAILVRVLVRDIETGDYRDFLQEWFFDLKEKGGLPGLRDYIGNYNAAYMTILALLTYLPIRPLYSIKAVSVLFDFLLAEGAVLFSRELIRKKKMKQEERYGFYLLVFTISLFLPTVVLNGALWGQCDSIYAAFSVFSLFFLVKKRYSISLLVFGAALAFKLQTIFLLPVFGIVWIMNRVQETGEFSIFNFLLIPFAGFLLAFPAILNGMPIGKLLSVYLGQTTEYAEFLTLNFPNIYVFLGNVANKELVYKIGIFFTLLLLLGILGAVLFRNRKEKIEVDGEKILLLAIVVLMVVVFFLPGMHERYFYVGEILILIYAMAEKRDYWFLFGMQTIAVYTYLRYFSGGRIFAVPEVAAIIFCFSGIFFFRQRVLEKKL